MSDLREELGNILNSLEIIKDAVRQRDKHLYEQWKAGGFLVDGNILSMYPNVETVVDRLTEGEEDEDVD